MKKQLNRYFADELNPQEKEQFLREVSGDDELRECFIENQQLKVLVDWMLVTDKTEMAQQKLSGFMQKIEKV